MALKTLGKDPKGSSYLSSAPNLSALLAFSSAFKDDLDASGEALRSIANALLLIDEARTTFISKEVNGGMTSAVMLEVGPSFISAHYSILSFTCPIRKLTTPIKYSSFLEFYSFVRHPALLSSGYW